MSDALNRILVKLGTPGLIERLGDMAPTDLQTLLLAVSARRAARRSPSDVLGDYERSRFFGAARLDAAKALHWQQIALDVAGTEFETLTLSPMTAFATCASVAPIAQDWSVTTMRSGEVVSDPTNVLALEAALRRRALLRADSRDAQTVGLMTTQRVIRPQNYGDPRMLAHFALTALVTAGRDRGNFAFEADAIAAHLQFHLTAYRRYLGDRPLLATYTATTDDARVAAFRRAVESLGVAVEAEPDREAVNGYYAGFCFHLWADVDGQRRQLADGGCVDWTAKLLSNAKERLFISGCGVEGLASLAPD